MNSMVTRVLVIGGGIGGMAAAIGLRRQGVEVDLAELDPQWRVYGAGITLAPVTLRALFALGFPAEIQRRGFCANGIDLYGINGEHLDRADTPRLSGPTLPSVGGIMRPVLREILADETVRVGTNVKLGVTFKEISQDRQAAVVLFTDGSRKRYDLIIAADGLRSAVRLAVFPDAPAPQYTGQACWRAVLARPPQVTGPQIYMGIRSKAGVNPVSQEEMYLFLNHPEPENVFLEDRQLPESLRQRLESYGGLMAKLRESLTPESKILYRPLEKLMVPSPWYAGRVLMIGDAVHATTPHLGAGAGMAVEDALALTEELARASSVDTALFRFMQRRFDRCQLVVEASARLGQLEQMDDSHDEHEKVRQAASAELARAF